MSTIKSADEHLTLNADGSGKAIKFQADGVEKASINSSGLFTSTTIDATALTGNLPAISGASLTGLTSSLSGLTDTTVSTSNPLKTTNPSAVGHLWVNKTSGECYVCTDVTTNENDWINIGSGSGNIYAASDLRAHDNTWWYTDASLSASLVGTNIQNLATGSSAISDVLPIDNGSRVSGGGASIFEYTTDTQAVRTNFSAADPFDIGTNGMSMGCLFQYEGGANGAGLIYYGDVAADNHFFCRSHQGGTHKIGVGEDTGSADVWTSATGTLVAATWYFLVVTIATDGTLHSSTNGESLVLQRSAGTAPTPTDALFGLNGDPYDDNAGQHNFGMAFFYKGVLTNTQVLDEYNWVKSIFTGASLP